MDLKIDLTDGQLKGLEYVTALANTARDAARAVDAEPETPLTAEAYLAARMAELTSSYERDMISSQEVERAALREQFAPTLNKVFALGPEQIQLLAQNVDAIIAQLGK